jgi:hypothetical protein
LAFSREHLEILNGRGVQKTASEMRTKFAGKLKSILGPRRVECTKQEASLGLRKRSSATKNASPGSRKRSGQQKDDLRAEVEVIIDFVFDVSRNSGGSFFR